MLGPQGVRVNRVVGVLWAVRSEIARGVGPEAAVHLRVIGRIGLELLLRGYPPTLQKEAVSC